MLLSSGVRRPQVASLSTNVLSILRNRVLHVSPRFHSSSVDKSKHSETAQNDKSNSGRISLSSRLYSKRLDPVLDKYISSRFIGKPKSNWQRRHIWFMKTHRKFAPLFADQLRPFARRVATALEDSELPLATLPEVAFVGRSNAGKSTLLNEIIGRQGCAYVEKIPGSTQAVDFYDVGTPSTIRLVDLPGYGFAFAREEQVVQWTEFSLRYLRTRANLRLVVIACDARVGLKNADREMASFLSRHRVPWIAMLTKADQVSPSTLNRMLQVAREDLRGLPHQAGPCIPVGAMVQQNMEEVRSIIGRFRLKPSEASPGEETRRSKILDLLERRKAKRMEKRERRRMQALQAASDKEIQEARAAGLLAEEDSSGGSPSASGVGEGDLIMRALSRWGLLGAVDKGLEREGDGSTPASVLASGGSSSGNIVVSQRDVQVSRVGVGRDAQRSEALFRYLESRGENYFAGGETEAESTHSGIEMHDHMMHGNAATSFVMEPRFYDEKEAKLDYDRFQVAMNEDLTCEEDVLTLDHEGDMIPQTSYIETSEKGATPEFSPSFLPEETGWSMTSTATNERVDSKKEDDSATADALTRLSPSGIQRTFSGLSILSTATLNRQIEDASLPNDLSLLGSIRDFRASTSSSKKKGAKVLSFDATSKSLTAEMEAKQALKELRLFPSLAHAPNDSPEKSEAPGSTNRAGGARFIEEEELTSETDKASGVRLDARNASVSEESNWRRQARRALLRRREGSLIDVDNLLVKVQNFADKEEDSRRADLKRSQRGTSGVGRRRLELNEEIGSGVLAAPKSRLSIQLAPMLGLSGQRVVPKGTGKWRVFGKPGIKTPRIRPTVDTAEFFGLQNPKNVTNGRAGMTWETAHRKWQSSIKKLDPATKALALATGPTKLEVDAKYLASHSIRLAAATSRVKKELRNSDSKVSLSERLATSLARANNEFQVRGDQMSNALQSRSLAPKFISRKGHKSLMQASSSSVDYSTIVTMNAKAQRSALDDRAFKEKLRLEELRAKGLRTNRSHDNSK